MQRNINAYSESGLYRPQFEHDACGLGYIANVEGKVSHKIVKDGLEILTKLEHRGASGADEKTGDGAGITIQIPDDFFRKECEELNIDLPERGDYGAGLIFMPLNDEERNQIGRWIQTITLEEDQIFLGFRKVPYNDEVIGETAKSSMPEFEHIFIGRGETTTRENFERKLYIIRKRIGHKVRNSDLYQKNFFYICSLSSKTIVYKGQFKADQIGMFFPDLLDEELKSALALVHSRYSTNTFPSWALAHPFRMIAHNGEINTLRSNINWYNAKEKDFKESKYYDEIKRLTPIIVPHKSDSATFDLILELLVHYGRTLPHALLMMVPEAYSEEFDEEEKKAFYKYHKCLMEAWDGPANISFTDGRYIGTLLDRNGLRPARYTITKDGLVIAASETGVVDVPEENILKKGRVKPGQLFLVDLHESKIFEKGEIKKEYFKQNNYKDWIDKNLVELKTIESTEKIVKEEFCGEKLIQQQKIFGYTEEDVNLLIKPMAEEGKEALGSMGDDTPIAVLSERPKLLFDYFMQLFAQVTNPPIDPIREKVVMSSSQMLGGKSILLEEKPEFCSRVKVDNPVISNEEFHKLQSLERDGFKSRKLSTLFNKEVGSENALEKIFEKADKAIDEGTNFIILSDRGSDKNNIPLPILLAASGLHHHLIKNGKRSKVSIICETAEAREVHHFAVLLGYGANLINPYLVFNIIKNEIEKGLYEGETSKLIENYMNAVQKGLLKVISKMGISTIQSYCGAQIFEAIGLNEEFVDKYFTSTPTRIGGIGLKRVEEETIRRHSKAFDDLCCEILDEGGNYKWRINGEYHQYNPKTISLLQQSVRSNDYKIFKEYSETINKITENQANIRSLFKLRKREEIPVDDVEPASEIMKRFATGAMSFGSISREAHETLAVSMNKIGGFSNTGEGGEDPNRFKVGEDGKNRNSRIKQIAQGRFGVTIEYLTNADQIQIKIAQGAKPGEGGQLPGHKVSDEIAKTRHTTPGVGLISPPPHHDIYSIEDLSQLIFDLKNANPNAQISVKLVSAIGVGTIAAGVAKGKADHILISGYDGGTGASPQTSIKHAGLPLELGLAEIQQVLVMNNLRGRVKLQADGQLKTGRDVIIAALLGAEEFGFATSTLVSMGCVLLRKCHQNACSVGIATQDPELRKMFTGKPDHVINYLAFIAEEVRELLAKLGFRKLDDIIGRVDLLSIVSLKDHWKAEKLDLTSILHKPDMFKNVSSKYDIGQIHELDGQLDNQLIELCKEGLDNGEIVRFSHKINNSNRALGTMLSHHIAKKYGLEGLKDDTISVNFYGSAGQSFGAFLANGITFKLFGEANDYVGKGLSGGKIIITPKSKIDYVASENIIIGNVALYGAIEGKMFINGQAGERFAVRNSGAEAVVEGLGDHGCEYMTGGRVVVLGKTGRNFAAGMSGGLAFIWDPEDDFKRKCNTEMVDLFSLDDNKDIKYLEEMIRDHFAFTNSKQAKYILNNWENEVHNFIKVYPSDYRKVIEGQSNVKSILKKFSHKVENITK